MWISKNETRNNNDEKIQQVQQRNDKQNYKEEEIQKNIELAQAANKSSSWENMWKKIRKME